jgi:putative MFS transporter
MQQSQVGRSPFQEQSVLSKNQRAVLWMVGLGNMLDNWNTYVIGYIMASLFKPWGLTYGVMSIVMLASGAGAIVGGAIWGAVADRFGRKAVLVGANFTVGLFCLAMAFTPEGNWMYLVVLRVLVGIAVASYLPLIGMCHEFVPPRRRGSSAGFVAILTGGGMILGALSGAYVIPAIGWRGTFALGFAPAIIALLALIYIPESPRWLSLHGRVAAARKSIAWSLGTPVYEGEIDVPHQERKQSWTLIFQCARACVSTLLINVGLVTAYYGIAMWAPTLLSQVQSIPLASAGKLMIVITAVGLPARWFATRLTDWIGRRKAGGLFGIAAAACTLLAGYVGRGDILSPSLFWLPLMLAFMFADGSFAICSVYSTEIWPSRLRGVGSGWAALTGSFGKIFGPLGLALMAGSSDVVMPSATVAAIVPAFQFLAFCLFVSGLTYLVMGIEARGTTLEAIDREFENSMKK